MLANATISRPKIISQKDLLLELDKLTAEVLYYESRACAVKKKRNEFKALYKRELEIIREFI